LAKGGDHTRLVTSAGLDLAHADLLLRAMERDKSAAGRKFNEERDLLYSTWLRLIRVLSRYRVPGWYPGPPVEFTDYSQWMNALQRGIPVWYPRGEAMTQQEKHQRLNGGLRISRRTLVNQYFNDIKELCLRWRLEAWWAVPALLQSHFFRLATGTDLLMGWYSVGGWVPPTYILVAQLPGTSLEDFEIDRRRFSQGRIVQPLPGNSFRGEWSIYWEPDREEMRLIEERYQSACVVIPWNGNNGYSSLTNPEVRVTISEHVIEECELRARRPLKKSEKREVKKQLAPQLRAGRNWFKEQGWIPMPNIDLDKHAQWVAARLLDPSRSWSEITGEGADLLHSRLRACYRFAKRAEINLGDYTRIARRDAATR
jgi:hypothetical protein